MIVWIALSQIVALCYWEDIFFKYFYAELWTATGAQYNGLGIMVLTILKIQNLFHKLWDLLELFLAFLVQRVL